MNAYAEAYYNPIAGFRNYGLKPGARIRILRGSGCISSEPDDVVVLEETPLFILCRYYFKHWAGDVFSYDHCLNKIGILRGEIEFRVIREDEPEPEEIYFEEAEDEEG